MKLSPYPTIKNDKVLLRQITSTDIPAIISICFYDALQAKTIEEATAMQAKIEQDICDGNSIHWGIINSTTNEIVGTCGYYRGLHKGEGELGCVLLPQFYGKGFMTEAMKLAIDYGLNIMGLKKIWAVTTNENSKAVKLLERLNFVKTADLEDNEVEYQLNN